MKTVLLVCSIFVFMITGCSQTRSIENEYLALNAEANWVYLGKSVKRESMLYIDTKSITYSKDKLVLFRIKWNSEVTLYASAIGSCDINAFIFTHMFAELPDGSLYHVNRTFDVEKADSNSAIGAALAYACNYKKGLDEILLEA